MKKTFLIFLSFFLFFTAFAQTETEDRMNLQNLLAERAKNFSAYTTAIHAHSGIFGNKTKGDILKSNAILTSIVMLDNDIMDALHRSLSYKTFEKATDNYSSRECEMKLTQSMQVTDTLMKQLTALEDRMKKSNSPGTVYKILFFLSLAVCLVLGIKLKQKSAGPAG
jgi:hypothetical protein